MMWGMQLWLKKGIGSTRKRKILRAEDGRIDAASSHFTACPLLFKFAYIVLNFGLALIPPSSDGGSAPALHLCSLAIY